MWIHSCCSMMMLVVLVVHKTGCNTGYGMMQSSAQTREMEISERPPDGQRCFMAIDHGYGSDGDVVVENARMTSDLNKSSLTPCRGKVLLSAMELSSQPMEPLGRC